MSNKNISVHPLLRPLINCISKEAVKTAPRMSSIELLHTADNYFSRALENPEMMERYLRVGKQVMERALLLLERDIL